MHVARAGELAALCVLQAICVVGFCTRKMRGVCGAIEEKNMHRKKQQHLFFVG
jgi:hypothetical protein